MERMGRRTCDKPNINMRIGGSKKNKNLDINANAEKEARDFCFISYAGLSSFPPSVVCDSTRITMYSA